MHFKAAALSSRQYFSRLNQCIFDANHNRVNILMMRKTKYYVMTLLRILFLRAMKQKEFIATFVILLLICVVPNVIQVLAHQTIIAGSTAKVSGTVDVNSKATGNL